jgi:hypothetical protein
MATATKPYPYPLEKLETEYGQMDKARLFIDQFIDIMLNHRQSGHPGGSRSKVHMMVALMTSGAMRWDVRRPEKALSDRFVLVAGHTIPLVYASLACVNHAMQLRYKWTGDERFKLYGGEDRILSPVDLLTLRNNGGLPGHAEFEGQDAVHQVQHRAFRPRCAGRGGPGAGSQARGLRRRQGLRDRRRGRSQRRHASRDQELGLRPWPRQPRLPDRLERLRHRPDAAQSRRPRHARGVVQELWFPHPRHRAGQ